MPTTTRFIRRDRPQLPRQTIGNTNIGAPESHCLRNSFAVNTLKRIKAQGTSAIARHLGIHRDTARRACQELAAEGVLVVEKRKWRLQQPASEIGIETEDPKGGEAEPEEGKTTHLPQPGADAQETVMMTA